MIERQQMTNKQLTFLIGHLWILLSCMTASLNNKVSSEQYIMILVGITIFIISYLRDD